jgi:hypothetical protein
LWLSVTASDDSLLLSDDVIKLSIRTRLGLETYTGNTNLQCVCGKVDAFKSDPYHAFTCNTTRSRGNIARHNLLLSRLALWTRRVNIHTEIEANHLSSDSRLRPDLLLTMKSGMRIVDVAVVHPLTQVRVSKEIEANEESEEESESGDSDEVEEAETQDMRMITIESVENMKRRKYKSLIRDYGAGFNTAAVETMGGLGKEFRDLLDDIAHEAMTNESGWEKEEIISGIRNAAAVAIQIGNARLIHENRNRILRRQVNLIRREASERGNRNKRRQRQNTNILSSNTASTSVRKYEPGSALR